MSSAKQRLRRVGIGGLSAAVGATVMFGLAAAPANAAWDNPPPTPAQAGPTNVGIADSSPQTGAPAGDNITKAGDAPLVMPGQSKQKLATVKLLVPESAFAQGDFVDLYLYNRSDAQSWLGIVGSANTNPQTKLGFDSTPGADDIKVTGPYASATTVTDAAGGTESASGPVAFTGPGGGQVVPSTAPQFTASLAHTSRAQFQGTNDILRLTVDNKADLNADPDAVWEVTLTGLTAEVGPDVTPGALRLAPFSYNKGAQGPTAGQGAYKAPTLWFNTSGATSVQSPQGPNVTWPSNNQVSGAPASWTVNGPANISTYTVVGFVAPATFTQADPTNIIADGTPQKVGDLTLTETSTIGLQPGTYTLHLHNLNIDLSNPPKASVKEEPLPTPNTPDTVTGLTAANSGTDSTITFKLNNGGLLNSPGGGLLQVANGTKDIITFSNLYVSSNQEAEPVTYQLTGGSVGNGTSVGGFLGLNGESTDIGQPYIAPYGQYGVRGQVAPVPHSFADFKPGQDIVAPPLKVKGLGVSLNKRIGGLNRYDTARKVAEALCGTVGTVPAPSGATFCVAPLGLGAIAGGGGAANVIIASGQNFPDALASNYLAGSLNGPILLTKENKIPQATLNGLRQLGTQHVYVVGGPSAVSNRVVNQLRNTRVYDQGINNIGQANLEVTRLGGANRYDTARIVNEYGAANSLDAQSVGTTNFKYGDHGKRTALVVTGQDYPDALSAGAPSFRNDYPMVLTNGSSLSKQASTVLNDLGIEQVVIVGGPSAVSSGVESAISGMGIAVKRVGSADGNRYDTATALADLEFAQWAPTTTTDGGFGFPHPIQTAILATGQNYADALTGGVYAGGNAYPMLLTKTAKLSPETQKWLSDNAGEITVVQALGLGQAVSQAALSAANVAISGE